MLFILDLKSERRNLICLPSLHWRQPGKAAETRSAPSAQPLMLILELGFGCPFKLYLELLSIFSWKSQVKARNSFLSGLTNKRGTLKNQIKKNQNQTYKAFCVKMIYAYLGLPTTIGAICLSCHRGLQATNRVTAIHIPGRALVVPNSRNKETTRQEADNLMVTALMAFL